MRRSSSIFPAITICNQNRIKESLIYQQENTRFRDLADIGRLFQGCKAILYDENGLREVTTLGFLLFVFEKRFKKYGKIFDI